MLPRLIKQISNKGTKSRKNRSPMEGMGMRIQTLFVYELELELIQAHMTPKPVLRVEAGACRLAQQTSTANR